MIPYLVTELPGPKARALLAESAQFELKSMSDEVPCVWARGEGAVIEDVDGNRLLDFSSGVLVMNIGHSHPTHVAAIREQAGTLLNCYDFVSAPRVRLAKKLVEITPPNLDRAYLLTTGSEAIEAAIKIARRATGRTEIISFFGGFHGRTYMAMAVGGKAGVKRGFGPLVPGVLHAPFPDYYRPPVPGMTSDQVDDYCLAQLDLLLETVSTGSVAAVITETYQGAAGSRVPSKRFMQGLQAWCRAHDFVFIVDEVQASFGRTGKLFGFEHFEIQPNIITLGKGISCGVPCSAVVAESRLVDVLETGSLSSTNGGNPISCRAALASIEILESEGLVENSARLGALMMAEFAAMQQDFPCLGDVRGQGLAIGLEFVSDPVAKTPDAALAKRIVAESYQRGLVMIAPIGSFGNVIRVAPPLVLDEALARTGLGILREALQAAVG